MLAFWHAPYRWPIAENVRAVEGLSLGASWVSSSALKPLYPLPPHANWMPTEPRRVWKKSDQDSLEVQAPHFVSETATAQETCHRTACSEARAPHPSTYRWVIPHSPR